MSGGRLSTARSSAPLALVIAVIVAAPPVIASADTAPHGTTTAWRDGVFQVDVANVVDRSDVILGQPNALPSQAMPLGNGALGVGVWAADGLTAQLNRADTLPDRLSVGRLVLPGLSQLTGGPDFNGRLDLYDGTFVESGGGMTALAYVRADTDQLVVEVRGADPGLRQTAELHLWHPRTPTVQASGPIGVLSESWEDVGRPGSSGQTFGAFAAVTAAGRNVRASVVDPLTVQVSFRPYRDGSFRVVVASPRWTGGDPGSTAAGLLVDAGARDAGQLGFRTLRWWHRYWHRVGLLRLSSADGVAQYMENLRTVNLFTAAAERGTLRPGSQAGVADLFDSQQDTHSWDPAAYWHWNLRAQVAANLGAGALGNNNAYFALYRNSLPSVESWTAAQFPLAAGACTPETMRFNGVGIAVHQSAGVWGSDPLLDCSSKGPASWNARTLSTGAEVSLFIWQTFLATDDLAFLQANYPVMADWARFMLSYAKVGTDGKLHTEPSNAHETQWDVRDPTTDIAAETALFPIVAHAAGLLQKDPDLVRQLNDALPTILSYPRTDAATRSQRLTSAADAMGLDVIANSDKQSGINHSTGENLGLEPVWPYGLIGDNSPLADLARRTFAGRPYVERYDWSFDPIDAARLGLSDDVAKTLVDLTKTYQLRPSGLASFGSGYPEPYAEQGAVATAALQDALVQDYDGLLRIAPALPSNWSADATVYIQHRARVHVQVRGGKPTTVAIDAGNGGEILLRNPWPGRRVQAVTADEGGGQRVIASTVLDTLTIPTLAGRSYLVQPADAAAPRFAPVTGTPAVVWRTLGPASIGLPTLSVTPRTPFLARG